ncbi:MAG: hypothetical protein GF344_12100 [Chitinivibrionales bacterium]|nr:hypothetical protein [Chitinivibrionales bacterium]
MEKYLIAGIHEKKVFPHWSFDSTADNTHYDVTGNGFDASSPGLALTDGMNGKAPACPDSDYKPEVAKSLDGFAVPHFTIEGCVYSDVAFAGDNSYGNIRSIFRYVSTSPGVSKGFGLVVNDYGSVVRF